MRILIVSSAFTPVSNGQAVFTHNLLDQLALAGHEVAAIVPSDQGQTYHTRRNAVEIQFLRTIDLSFIYPTAVFTPFPLMMLEKVMHSFKPDVIHIQDHYPLCDEAVSVARRRHVKVVGTNHFMPENVAPVVPWASQFERPFEWLLWHWMLATFNRLDVAVAPSRTAVEIIQRQGLRVPAFPVTCGVSLDHFFPEPDVDIQAWRKRYGIAEDKIIFFFVGRVDREKRLDIILEAMSHLKRNDIQFVIAGTGAYVTHLSELAEKYELGDSVRFTGYIPNEHLPHLLNSIDIFSMPSEAELLSIATLEAMASARPVLLARAQALPELAEDGENGFLFRAGDVDDAARCITLMADQPEKWKSWGEASYARARNHSLTSMRERYEAVYRQALEMP